MRADVTGIIVTQFICSGCGGPNSVFGIQIYEDSTCSHCGIAVYIKHKDLGE